MIEVEIKSIIANDFDISSQFPGNPENFGFWIEMEIGQKNAASADLFQLFVCSPAWIQAQLSEDRVWWPHASLVIRHFNYFDFLETMNNKISQVQGDNWEQIVSQLRLLARWEFEGYISHPG
ncbi:Imm8 family immunity protein [Xenophilus arseniciresistens]|uniref:Imm8 family immunity protein n=1 Tax=Xenophilus arseniciresistens TaxID=1283306 RepID=A0AAE3N927_9BURK|nr:Imm8 family immunity protein [Xenophilus arseniciresistens]MDA7418215.1 Imm8 family immunity protein [Xenophilus arseniciresistens]